MESIKPLKNRYLESRNKHKYVRAGANNKLIKEITYTPLPSK